MNGSLLQDSEDMKKEDRLNMIKCDIQTCRNFFHRSCIEKMRKKFPFIDQECDDMFICPVHFCHRCEQPFEDEDSFVSCVRCLKSYHSYKEPEDIES